MSSVEIVSYTAHVGRLGMLGSERLMALHHQNQAEDGTVVSGTSEIYFSDRFATGGGFNVVNHESHIRAHLPMADYETWLDLVRHEAPVFLHWTSDVIGEPDGDGVVHLSTGPEPLGEGPTDQSPGHGV